MAHGGPSSQAAMDAAGATLRRLVSPLLDDPATGWLRRFLLESTGAAEDMAILANSRPAANAVVLSVALSSVEESGALSGAADHAASAHFYCVPVAASTGHSVGLAAQRLLAPDGSIEFGVGRYVVCNDTGAMLVLWLETLNHDGSGHGERSTRDTSAAMFSAVALLVNGERPRLPPALRDEDGECPRHRIRLQYIGPRSGSDERGALGSQLEDLYAVCDAAAFYAGRYAESLYVVTHTRRYERVFDDENGGAATPMAMSLHIPSSLTDYDSQVANVVAHVGRFRGRMECNIGVPGAVPRSVRLFKNVTAEVRVSGNPLVGVTMRQIVLQCRMEKDSNVRRLQVCSAGSHLVAQGPAAASIQAQAAAPSQEVAATPSQEVAAAPSHEVSVAPIILGAAPDLAVPAAPSQIEATPQSQAVMAASSPGQAAVPNQGQAAGPNQGQAAAKSQAQAAARIRACVNNAAGERLVAIAPRPGVSPPSSSYVDSAREEKTRLRKEKNKVAAARSNARRKREVEELKDDLAAMVKRVEQLRAYEMELRRENRDLRRMWEAISDEIAHEQQATRRR